VGDLGNVQPVAGGRVFDVRFDRLISLFDDNNILGRVADVSVQVNVIMIRSRVSNCAESSFEY